MRKLRVALALLLLFSAVAPAAGLDREWDFEDIYLADDEDPKAEDVPRFAPMPLSIILSSDLEINKMAKAYDFYYLITSPTQLLEVQLDSEAGLILPNVDYETFVLNKYKSTVTEENASKWPTGITPKDSRFIKDAYIENVGFRDGYKYETNHSGLLNIVPASGRIRTTLDYRVDAPERTCSVNNQTKICHNLTVDEVTVLRTFTAGKYSYNNLDSRGQLQIPGVIEYQQLPSETTTASVKATFETTYVNKTTTYDFDEANESWVVNKTSRTVKTTTFNVTDEFRIRPQQDQELTVKQRVINRSADENIIVLEFQGPAKIPDRRLWSYAKVGDNAFLENIWGLYSARHSRYGQIRRNTGDTSRFTTYPAIPSLRLTATTTKPKVLYLGSSSGQKSIFSNIRVTSVETANFSTPKPVISQSNVDLPSEQPPRVQSVVIRGAEVSSIQTIRDLQNQEIAVETVRKEYRATNITVTRINETAIRLTLTDDEGQPVPGRPLVVNGNDSFVTNESGQVVVHTEKKSISARFTGDKFTERHEIYYGESTLSTVIGVESPFYVQLYRLILSLRYFATGFGLAIVLFILGTTLSG